MVEQDSPTLQMPLSLAVGAYEVLGPLGPRGNGERSFVARRRAAGERDCVFSARSIGLAREAPQAPVFLANARVEGILEVEGQPQSDDQVLNVGEVA